MAQDYADNNKAVDVTGTVSWDAAVPKDVEGQKMLELSISLAVSDCEPTSANNYCGVGRCVSDTKKSKVAESCSHAPKLHSWVVRVLNKFSPCQLTTASTAAATG